MWQNGDTTTFSSYKEGPYTMLEREYGEEVAINEVLDLPEDEG